MIPYQITFLDFPESDSVWLAVESRIEKLEHFYDRIQRCEVTLSCPHRHRPRHSDRLFQVHIHLIIPGENVNIDRSHSKNESHTDVYIAIRDSFDAAERQLQDRVDILRRNIKFHQQRTIKPREEVETDDLSSP